MNGNRDNGRAPDLAALRAVRERVEYVHYVGRLREMSDSEFDAEMRHEAGAILGIDTDALSESEVAAAIEDALFADLGERDPATLSEYDRRELAMWRARRPAGA